MESFIIRRLKPEDADDIKGISAAITSLPTDYDFNRMIEEQALRSEDASFVAEIEGKVVGYIITSIFSGLFGIKRSAWLSLIGVHPRYMGRRIGERLAEEGFRFCKEQGIKDIYTSVRWDSTDLLSFFKTLGFDRSNFINLRKILE
ncbi:MAG: N-acetyltransferase family protein [Desulfatirhabdiaceae bacterium]